MPANTVTRKLRQLRHTIRQLELAGGGERNLEMRREFNALLGQHLAGGADQSLQGGCFGMLGSADEAGGEAGGEDAGGGAAAVDEAPEEATTDETPVVEEATTDEFAFHDLKSEEVAGLATNDLIFNTTGDPPYYTVLDLGSGEIKYPQSKYKSGTKGSVKETKVKISASDKEVQGIINYIYKGQEGDEQFELCQNNVTSLVVEKLGITKGKVIIRAGSIMTEPDKKTRVNKLIDELKKRNGQIKYEFQQEDPLEDALGRIKGIQNGALGSLQKQIIVIGGALAYQVEIARKYASNPDEAYAMIGKLQKKDKETDETLLKNKKRIFAYLKTMDFVKKQHPEPGVMLVGPTGSNPTVIFVGKRKSTFYTFDPYNGTTFNQSDNVYPFPELSSEQQRLIQSKFT